MNEGNVNKPAPYNHQEWPKDMNYPLHPDH